MKLAMNRQLHLLLSKAKLMEQKSTLIESFSSGRTSTSTDLTDEEANSLITYLKGLIDKVETEYKEEEKRKDKTRKYIISVWYRMENASTKDEMQQARLKCFNWVLKNFKSDLNSFKMADLLKIKRAAENALKDRAKAVRRAVKNV